jgi:hypothetical protein
MRLSLLSVAALGLAVLGLAGAPVEATRLHLSQLRSPARVAQEAPLVVNGTAVPEGAFTACKFNGME